MHYTVRVEHHRPDLPKAQYALKHVFGCQRYFVEPTPEGSLQIVADGQGSDQREGATITKLDLGDRVFVMNVNGVTVDVIKV